MNTTCSPCLILTGTIVAHFPAYVERVSAQLRLDDYELALRKWIANPHIARIAFIENSGYDLSTLKEVAEEMNEGRKEIEFISFSAEEFPREFGKGYGETLALIRAVEGSRLLATAGKFVKVSGRYYVANVHHIMERVAGDTDIVCDLRRHLTWGDSRVFGGSLEFLRDYVCREGLRTNETAGMYFEHALGRAVHRAIADGKRWSLLPCAPIVSGISATYDKPYHTSWYHRLMQSMFLYAKRLLLSR